MKKHLLLFALLLCAMSAFAAKKPDPADYNVTVHVTASRVDGCIRELDAVIGGVNYQLSAACAKIPISVGVLKLGDYKAKLVKDDRSSAFFIMQAYEILFPDGTKKKFDVVGVSQ